MIADERAQSAMIAEGDQICHSSAAGHVLAARGTEAQSEGLPHCSRQLLHVIQSTIPLEVAPHVPSSPCAPLCQSRGFLPSPLVPPGLNPQLVVFSIGIYNKAHGTNLLPLPLS